MSPESISPVSNLDPWPPVLLAVCAWPSLFFRVTVSQGELFLGRIHTRFVGFAAQF
jgi:hypothetical protein